MDTDISSKTPCALGMPHSNFPVVLCALLYSKQIMLIFNLFLHIYLSDSSDMTWIIGCPCVELSSQFGAKTKWTLINLSVC